MIRYAYIIPFLPLLSFFINIAVGKRLPRKGDWLCLGTIAIGLAMSIGIFYEVFRAYDPNFRYHVVFPWLTVGDRALFNTGILIDNVTAVMLLVVTIVSTLVHLFSIGYMHGDPRYSRYFAYLSIFSFSMLGLVLAESFLFIYIFWELVGLSSYLLIGFWFEKKSASDAGKKAFIVNRVGDFGFLIGILIIYATCGVLGYDQVFLAIGEGKLSGTLLTLAGIGVFCGAIGKSAQFPLHVWLPDAMEGPTPVSALIHAATMVAAGVYLVGRVYPMFTPDAFLFIACIGLITLFLTATIALAQNDIKKVLAYSTCSQLGYMIMGLGVGGYTAGLAHLATHAAFKACLFLGSGSVIHAVHSQDIQEMGGLRKKMPITFVTFLIATLAISGVPGFSGFYSKDMILGAALEFGMKSANPLHMIFFIGALFTAGLTAFYMFRLVILTFFGAPKDHHKFDHAHESPPSMWVPLVILAGLSFSFWYSGWFGTLIQKPKSVANLAGISAPAKVATMEHAAVMAPAPPDGPVAAGTAARNGLRPTGLRLRQETPHAAVPAAHGESHDGASHDRPHRAHGPCVRDVLLGGGGDPRDLPRLRGVLLRVDQPGPRRERGEAAPQLPAEQVVLRRTVRSDGDQRLQGSLQGSGLVRPARGGRPGEPRRAARGLRLVPRREVRRLRRRRGRQRPGKRDDRQRIGPAPAPDRKAVPLRVRAGRRCAHHFPDQGVLRTEVVVRGVHR